MNNSEHNSQSTRFVSKKKILFISLAVILLSVGTYVGHFHFNLFTTTQTKKLLKRPDTVPGKIVTLKRIKEEHALDYHNMFSKIVRKNLEFPDSINLGWSIAYVKSQIKKDRDGLTMLYSIFDNKDNKLIGAIQIREPNPDDPGQFGTWINENYWGGGRFQEAFKLINKTYFAVREADSYIAHVRLWNVRSFKALSKAGMVEIGKYFEGGKPTRHILEMRRQ